MGKIAKPKPRATGPSLHSRAAKRASSPSLDLDKSITTAPRPEDPSAAADEKDLTNRDMITRKVIDIAHRTTTSNGISKKNRDNKRGTRTKQQKKRIEIGREKAEAIAEILDRKVEERLKQQKAIKERASDWETINSKTQFEALASVEI